MYLQELLFQGGITSIPNDQGTEDISNASSGSRDTNGSRSSTDVSEL